MIGPSTNESAAVRAARLRAELAAVEFQLAQEADAAASWQSSRSSADDHPQHLLSRPSTLAASRSPLSVGGRWEDGSNIEFSDQSSLLSHGKGSSAVPVPAPMGLVGRVWGALSFTGKARGSGAGVGEESRESENDNSTEVAEFREQQRRMEEEERMRADIDFDPAFERRRWRAAVRRRHNSSSSDEVRSMRGIQAEMTLFVHAESIRGLSFILFYCLYSGARQRRRERHAESLSRFLLHCR